uniref:Uncharacterized protein n=1 Tax=viral metagenome TaxID=1070528 RepID=A0A6C0F8I4_9ZZZZ|tara:strand:- start:10795 stop:11685 length:891 start_codon:yes stop_codon:yes gene_type:complete
MKNCCNHASTDTQCKRKSDGKIFDLPRKYSRKRCRNPKGFTMKSSCAPYKDCYKNKHKHKKKNKTRKQKTQKKQRGSGNKTRRRRDNTRKVTRKTINRKKQTAGSEQEPQAPAPEQPPSPVPDPELSPQQSWMKLLPALAERTVNPLHCIAAQWLVLNTHLSSKLEAELSGSINQIRNDLNSYLGENGIEQHIASDDFYTKWTVGGLGHACAVVISDSSMLPGAGIVGMVHQIATEKAGPTVAQFFRKLKGKQITSPDDLENKLRQIKQKWLEKLPIKFQETYKNTDFLETITNET